MDSVRRWSVLFGLLVFALAAFLLMPTQSAEAKGPTTTKIVFQLVDETGKPLKEAAGRIDLWVRGTGADYLWKPIVNGRVEFDLQEGTEYMAFLGLAPWPEPGFPKYRVVGLTFKHITPSSNEVCPYATFISSGKSMGQVTFALRPI